MMQQAYGEALPPVYVTETGCAYDDAPDASGRVATSADRLPRRAPASRRQAIETGVDVRGYFTWSPARQLRVGRGLHQALRPGPRRLRDPDPDPKDSYRLVRPHDRREPAVTALPPTGRSPRPGRAGRARRAGTPEVGRAHHARLHRPLGGVLRADPGAARAAGGRGRPGEQGVRVRARHGGRRRRLGRLQPAVRGAVGPHHLRFGRRLPWVRGGPRVPWRCPGARERGDPGVRGGLGGLAQAGSTRCSRPSPRRSPTRSRWSSAGWSAGGSRWRRPSVSWSGRHRDGHRRGAAGFAATAAAVVVLCAVPFVLRTETSLARAEVALLRSRSSQPGSGWDPASTRTSPGPGSPGSW